MKTREKLTAEDLDLIARFKDLCNIYIDQLHWKKSKVVAVSDVPWPTWKKIMEEDISTMHFETVTLHKMQQFIDNHALSNLKDNTELQDVVKNDPPETEERPGYMTEYIPESSEGSKNDTHTDDPVDTVSLFWEHLRAAYKYLPPKYSLTLTVGKE